MSCFVGCKKKKNKHIIDYQYDFIKTHNHEFTLQLSQYSFHT